MTDREKAELDLREKVVARFKKGITKTMTMPGGKKITNYNQFLCYCMEKDKEAGGFAFVVTNETL